MTYQPDPSLFVENGPALTARRIHRHDAYRILLGTDPAPKADETPRKADPKADNDTAVSECGIRFAL